MKGEWQWLNGWILLISEAFEALELCAGSGIVTRCLRRAGVHTVALDIAYWDAYSRPTKATTNPLDLLQDSGMATLVPNILNSILA